MQITTANNQQNHSTLSRDIDNLLFQRTLGMLHHSQLKQQLKFPLMRNYMQQVNKITQPFPEILAFCYFERMLSMPDQTQQILHDLTKVFMDI